MFSWFNQRFLSLKHFYATSGALLPWLIGAFFIFITYGVIDGLFIAPADYQQGDGFRIIYVHVPSAFTAMAIYFTMAICGVLTLVFRVKIAAIAMSCSASIGAWFTFLALVTGSLFGETYVGHLVDMGCTYHICLSLVIFIYWFYHVAILYSRSNV